MAAKGNWGSCLAGAVRRCPCPNLVIGQEAITYTCYCPPASQVGIVGLPNVGKSTLFNTLTKMGIPAENFPFCTIDPNSVWDQGVVVLQCVCSRMY